jgi:hypothetical protein
MLQGRITLDYDRTYPRYKLSGKWDKPHPRLLRITELPVGLWTKRFKKHLAGMLEPTTKNAGRVEPVKNQKDVPATIEVLPPLCRLYLVKG